MTSLLPTHPFAKLQHHYSNDQISQQIFSKIKRYKFSDIRKFLKDRYFVSFKDDNEFKSIESDALIDILKLILKDVFEFDPDVVYAVEEQPLDQEQEYLLDEDVEMKEQAFEDEDEEEESSVELDESDEEEIDTVTEVNLQFYHALQFLNPYQKFDIDLLINPSLYIEKEWKQIFSLIMDFIQKKEAIIEDHTVLYQMVAQQQLQENNAYLELDAMIKKKQETDKKKTMAFEQESLLHFQISNSAILLQQEQEVLQIKQNLTAEYQMEQQALLNELRALQDEENRDYNEQEGLSQQIVHYPQRVCEERQRVSEELTVQMKINQGKTQALEEKKQILEDKNDLNNQVKEHLSVMMRTGQIQDMVTDAKKQMKREQMTMNEMEAEVELITQELGGIEGVQKSKETKYKNLEGQYAKMKEDVYAQIQSEKLEKAEKNLILEQIDHETMQAEEEKQIVMQQDKAQTMEYDKQFRHGVEQMKALEAVVDKYNQEITCKVMEIPSFEDQL